MTVIEFEKNIADGKQYVMLDEYVLDVNKFIHHHPGGEWLLKHNIGRDISKFFYGGYNLDGNLGVRMPAPGHIHTNFARKVANDLIIATISQRFEAKTEICKVIRKKTRDVNSSTSTFVL